MSNLQYLENIAQFLWSKLKKEKTLFRIQFEKENRAHDLSCFPSCGA